MRKYITILILLMLPVCRADRTPTEEPSVPARKQTAPSAIPYRIGKVQGLSVQPIKERHVLQGKGGFKMVLLPAEGHLWNMESVSVLGVELKNTGTTVLVLDAMLCNENASRWSNSSLGRTIVKPGEEIPLAVALGRRNNHHSTHSHYFHMSGLPSGLFSHWHTIDPSKVKRLEISCELDGEHAFEIGKMFALQPMDESKMGVFPFIDKYGQYMLKEWPGKICRDKDLKKGPALEQKLERELKTSTQFSKYGGWKDGPRFEATGRFRTMEYQGRWWFVDPEGYLFWSHGVTCVGIGFAAQTPTGRDPGVFSDLPAEDDAAFGQFHSKRDVERHYALLEDVPHYEFTQSNLYRKYGKDWRKKQVEQDIRRLKYCHLNTIGAWSDDAVAAQKKVPYTAMIHYEYAFAGEKVPDPFNPRTRAGLRKSIEEYPVDFKNDPWCLGAFVNNELHWENNAVRMTTKILCYDQRNEKVKQDTTEVKKAFRDWLKEKYTGIEVLNESWKTSFKKWDDLLYQSDWGVYSNANPQDCSALITYFAETFFSMVREELDRHSPGVLYLGCRFHKGPREVHSTAAKYADVISCNWYSYSPYIGGYGSYGKPVLISEYHFVNVTGNNLGGGLRSAQDAVQQGRLYRAYIEKAVDDPKIIGVHWFQWRDHNVGGRYDGENYNMGFYDVADQPNEELIRAAAESGCNLYSTIRK